MAVQNDAVSFDIGHKAPGHSMALQEDPKLSHPNVFRVHDLVVQGSVGRVVQAVAFDVEIVYHSSAPPKGPVLSGSCQIVNAGGTFDREAIQPIHGPQSHHHVWTLLL